MKTNYSHMPLVEPVEFANSALPWNATRVTAAAFLGTNVTQVLNKSGTVLGGRLSPAVVDAWRCTAQNITNLHPAEKAYLPLETGVYTYCPPSTDLVFFTDYSRSTVQASTHGGLIPIFSLENDSMYNKMFLTPAGADEALACTVTWHIEFRTSSALFQVGLSAMTLESLHTAQLILAAHGFFFENPEHKGMLNRIIALAKQFAPAAVSMIHPMAGKALEYVAGRYGKQVTPKAGPSKPPTTSAAKSGIVVGSKRGSAPKAKAKPAAKKKAK